MTPCCSAASNALCLINKFETSFPCDSGGHDFCICMKNECIINVSYIFTLVVCLFRQHRQAAVPGLELQHL